MSPNRTSDELTAGRRKSGTVTSIQVQVRNPERVSVFIDGEFAFGLHSDIIVSEGLSRGIRITEEQGGRLLDMDDYYRAREAAYRLLSYRQRSTAELAERLRRKGASPDATRRVIKRFHELGLLDDEAFATNWAESRLRSKGYGPQRIRSELYRKGIERELADRILADTFENVSPEDLALEAARKIGPRLKREPDTAKRRRKLTGYLTRRGFSFDQMEKALASLDSKPEEV